MTHCIVKVKKLGIKHNVHAPYAATATIGSMGPTIREVEVLKQLC
jgi:hypothetical protein